MNNDGPMMLLSTTLLLLMVQRLERALSVGAWLLLGVLYGVIVMTKASGAAAFPVALVLLAYQWRRQSLSSGGVLARAAAYYGTAFALSFWWFLDIKLRWGRFHPIPKSDLNPLLLHESIVDLLTSGRGWFCVKRFLIGAQQSAWGQVDWFLPMNGQHGVAFYTWSVACYLVFTVLSVLALTGLGLLVVRWLQKSVQCPPEQKAGVALLVTHAGLAFAALTHFALFQHPGGYQGSRYLYPSVAALGTLFVLGLGTLLPARWHKWLAPALMGGLLVWNVFCALNLIGYLNPLYAPGEGVELRLR
jgi:4-amino-4-deoxy-L-arabinose transferase-like glycosyltransferase